MLSQDDHQLWGSSITTGKTAFSDVLVDFREDRRGRATQLAQESDNHANRSVVILVCLIHGAVMQATQQAQTCAETSAKAL